MADTRRKLPATTAAATTGRQFAWATAGGTGRGPAAAVPSTAAIVAYLTRGAGASRSRGLSGFAPPSPRRTRSPGGWPDNNRTLGSWSW